MLSDLSHRASVRASLALAIATMSQLRPLSVQAAGVSRQDRNLPDDGPQTELHFGAQVALSLLLALISLVAFATLADYNTQLKRRRRRRRHGFNATASDARAPSGLREYRTLSMSSTCSSNLFTSSTYSDCSTSQSSSTSSTTTQSGELIKPKSGDLLELAQQILLAFSLLQSARQIFGHHQYLARQQSSSDQSAATTSTTTTTTTGSINSLRNQHQQTKHHEQQQPLERECIDSLHGLRFLSMIWVIVIHSYNFALRWTLFADTITLDGLYSSALSQLIANGSFACDSFFFASGFLLPYSVFNNSRSPNSSSSSNSTPENIQQQQTTNKEDQCRRWRPLNENKNTDNDDDQHQQQQVTLSRTVARSSYAKRLSRAAHVSILVDTSLKSHLQVGPQQQRQQQHVFSACCCCNKCAQLQVPFQFATNTTTTTTSGEDENSDTNSMKEQDQNTNEQSRHLKTSLKLPTNTNKQHQRQRQHHLSANLGVVSHQNATHCTYSLPCESAPPEDSAPDNFAADNSSAPDDDSSAAPGLAAAATPPPFTKYDAHFSLKQILANILHRYVRMMPLMMAIIGLCATLMRYLGDGPVWRDSTMMYDGWCRKNWWINALFLHNFVNRENMCLSHSWYSAVDLQLFLLSQLLLFVLVKSRKFGLLLLVGLICCSQLITMFLTIAHHLPAVPLVSSVNEQTMNLYYGEIYIKPYCRASPYLIGILLAYLMRTTRLGQLKLQKWQLVAGWSLCLGAFVAIILAMQPAMNGLVLSELESALYSALSRPLWALATGWMIFACITKQAGFLARILSAKCFIPLSRLTYPAFLVHPIVMALFYGSRPASFHFSHYLMLYLILGNIVITYASAFILAALIELPLLSIERTISKRLLATSQSQSQSNNNENENENNNNNKSNE